MSFSNEQKHSYVKKQLTSALLKLLKDKPLDAISIKELTDTAQVARVSFYRSFSCKEEILKQESDRLIRQWGKEYESNPASSPLTLFPSLFDFYKEHRDFYLTLYQTGLTFIMLDTILDTIRIEDEMSSPKAYLKSFWAYGIYGWMMEWMRRGMQEEGSELLKMFE